MNDAMSAGLEIAAVLVIACCCFKCFWDWRRRRLRARAALANQDSAQQCRVTERLTIPNGNLPVAVPLGSPSTRPSGNLPVAIPLGSPSMRPSSGPSWKAAAIDTNGDGCPDTLAVDSNGDGVIDKLVKLTGADQQPGHLGGSDAGRADIVGPGECSGHELWETRQLRRPSEKWEAPDIFISFRFGEAHAEALALKAALEARQLKVFLSNASPGSDLQRLIAFALSRCKLAVILATTTYGKKTNALFCTSAEMNYIVGNNRKPYYLVRMIPFDDDFAEPLTTMAFPPSVMFKLWQPGEPMPADLVDEVVAKVEDLMATHIQGRWRARSSARSKGKEARDLSAVREHRIKIEQV